MMFLTFYVSCSFHVSLHYFVIFRIECVIIVVSSADIGVAVVVLLLLLLNNINS